MIDKYILPLFAIGLLIFATVESYYIQRPTPELPPPVPPTTSPFGQTVAGAGMVEASTEASGTGNIAIGSQLSGTVAKLCVRIGETVRAGDVLFELDLRQAEAELQVRLAAQAAAEKQLRQLELRPRAGGIATQRSPGRCRGGQSAAAAGFVRTWTKVGYDVRDHRRRFCRAGRRIAYGTDAVGTGEGKPGVAESWHLAAGYRDFPRESGKRQSPSGAGENDARFDAGVCTGRRHDFTDQHPARRIHFYPRRSDAGFNGQSGTVARAGERRRRRHTAAEAECACARKFAAMLNRKRFY